MCVVSMVTDHYWRRYPSPAEITPSIYRDIEELIRRAREYDRLTGQPDCPEQDKADWWKRVQEAQKTKLTDPLRPTYWLNTETVFNK